MIIGNGMIANAFSNEYKNNNSVVIFASGVSNSLEISKKEFLREKELLLKTIFDNKKKLIVYFSTVSIFDSTRNKDPYVRHKLEMENIVSSSNQYLILRLPNVVGHGGNPKTLINYFVSKISNNESIRVWQNAFRNIIGADDMTTIATDLIQKKVNKNTIKLTNPKSYKVTEIVNEIGYFLNSKPNMTVIKKGKYYNTSPSKEVVKSIKDLQIRFDGKYLTRILDKYYYDM